MRLLYTTLILLLMVNLVGLGVIYHKLDSLPQFPYQLLQDNAKTQSETSAKITNLENLLAKILPESSQPTVLGLSDILPEKSNRETNTPNHFISPMKDLKGQVQVYKEQADFSTVLGQLIVDYKYPYFAKQGSWYLIGLTDNKTGWVKASQIIEIP